VRNSKGFVKMVHGKEDTIKKPVPPPENPSHFGKKDASEEEDGFPTAVEITLTYEDQGQDVQIIRMVMVPTERVVDEVIGGDDEDDEENEDA